MFPVWPSFSRLVLLSAMSVELLLSAMSVELSSNVLLPDSSVLLESVVELLDESTKEPSSGSQFESFTGVNGELRGIYFSILREYQGVAF